MAKDRQPKLWKGAVAGLAAGLAASFAMTRFQALVVSLSPAPGGQGEPATQQAADRVARLTTGDAVPDDRKPLAGELVHYTLGALLGVGYGVAAERDPAVTAGFGTAFASGAALLIDELAVPAAGLGAAPWQTAPATHLYSLASHWVFGASAELTRRLVRRTLA